MSGSQLMLVGAVPAGPADDPYFNSTTVLLPGNGTNGGQNNTFLDSSTNAFTVTRSGATPQGTFSPFSQTGWSNYFDGSGDYLTFAYNSAFSFGSGDFTIEGWWNIYSLSSASQIITFAAASPGSGSDIAFYIYMDGSANEATVCNGGNYYSVTGWSSNVTLNQWQHFAFVRDGSTLRFYINGVQRGTAAGGVTINDNSGWTLRLATYTASTRPLNGYLSNIRLIKGTCQYPNGTTFTPSTTPLTAVSGTSLLTCQSNRFKDNSTNNFTPTVSGTPTVQAFSPFNPTLPYSTSVNGGSGFFDGGSDLSVANNTAFDLTTGDFTIEAFAYKTGEINAGYGVVIGKYATNYNDSFYITYNDDDIIRFGMGFSDGSYYEFYTASAYPMNEWHHIAAVRSGSTISLFVDGVRTNTTTNSKAIKTTTARVVVGNFDGYFQYFLGYVSSPRIVKGTAVYDPTQSTLTVPTAPLTAVSGTSLLISGTNASITDATAKADFQTVGNAQTSTTQSKFNGSSMYFDGSGDRLVALTNPIYNFADGDFTVECWLYQTTNNAYAMPIEFSADGGGGYGWFLEYSATRGVFFYMGTGGGNSNISYSFTPTLNVWTHVAVTRSSGTARIFLDGVVVATQTLTSSSVSTNPLVIGSSKNGTYPFTGYLQDVRVTKGVARYTANFTPPSTAFPLY